MNRNLCKAGGCFIITILLLLTCIQAAGAAVNVYTIVVRPDTELIGNQTPVEVVAMMDITSEGQYTFSEDHTLKFWTDLKNPVYTPVLSRNGDLISLPERYAKSMTLTSWDLSYPSGSRLSLKVTVRGLAPEVTSTREMTMIQIAEATPSSVIKSSEVNRTRLITYREGAVPEPEPFAPKGSIEISSTPQPSAIAIDGTPHGMTPALVTGITAGNRLVTLSHPGYHDADLVVSVIEGQTIRIAATLHPAPVTTTGSDGFVTVRSVPEGAEVMAGGQLIGKTPVFNHRIPAGIHRLHVTREGYLPYSTDLQVIPGELNSVLVHLSPPGSTVAVPGSPEEFTSRPEVSGCIRCLSDPPGADVYLDQLPHGRTPLMICNLTPGNHDVVMLYPFFRQYKTSVRVAAGETAEAGVAFTLSDLEFPGLSVLLGFFSNIELPQLPGIKRQEGSAADDRQKAYEEMLKQMGEEEM